MAVSSQTTSSVIQPASQKSLTEKFDDFFSSRTQDKRVAILMQPSPDPDAMGAALGVQWLMEARYGLSSDLFASGEVSHPQNQTAINVLDLRVKDKDSYDPQSYETVVVVDTVPQNTGFTDVIDTFHVIIDHHHFDVDAPFVDIRPVGAACSIVWEYLKDFELDFETEKGKQVATALLFGIRNDTGGLLSENCTELDMAAHAHLMKHIDRKKLHEIMNYSFPSYLYDLRAQAVESKVIQDSVLISGVGILTAKKRDALPVIADEFLRMEGIKTVVIFAIVGDAVEASVRSMNSSINVHEFCQSVFGKDHAGGKPGSGGASVPMGFLYNPTDKEDLRNEIYESAQKIITQRILDYLLG